MDMKLQPMDTNGNILICRKEKGVVIYYSLKPLHGSQAKAVSDNSCINQLKVNRFYYQYLLRHD